MHDVKADQELLAFLRQGNSDAFAEIYRKFAPALLDYMAIRIDNLEDASDIIHDIFVQLWETRAELEIKHSFKAYLFFCVKRRILNYYRKNHNKQLYAQRLQLLADSFVDSPDARLEAKELGDMVQKILSEMPKKVREIYLLSREQHLSIKEIAVSLNISEQTVKNQLYTATSILKSKFRNAGILSMLLIDLFIRLK